MKGTLQIHIEALAMWQYAVFRLPKPKQNREQKAEYIFVAPP